MNVEVIETKTGKPTLLGISHLEPGTVFQDWGQFYVVTDEESAVRPLNGALLSAHFFEERAVEVIHSAKLVIER